MRRHLPIQMEHHACRGGGFERMALVLLIAVCIGGFCATLALAWGCLEYSVGMWPL